jgi:uncharacterized protein YodC (DUF2158 family)
MQNQKFKSGDLVVLKSGSPTMTVKEYDLTAGKLSETELWCIWFDGSEKKSAKFHHDTLELKN